MTNPVIRASSIPFAVRCSGFISLSTTAPIINEEAGLPAAAGSAFHECVETLFEREALDVAHVARKHGVEEDDLDFLHAGVDLINRHLDLILNPVLPIIVDYKTGREPHSHRLDGLETSDAVEYFTPGDGYGYHWDQLLNYMALLRQHTKLHGRLLVEELMEGKLTHGHPDIAHWPVAGTPPSRFHLLILYPRLRRSELRVVNFGVLDKWVRHLRSQFAEAAAAPVYFRNSLCGYCKARFKCPAVAKFVHGMASIGRAQNGLFVGEATPAEVIQLYEDLKLLELLVEETLKALRFALPPEGVAVESRRLALLEQNGAPKVDPEAFREWARKRLGDELILEHFRLTLEVVDTVKGVTREEMIQAGAIVPTRVKKLKLLEEKE